MDKLETKVAKSFDKERTVRERAKGWEEVNVVPGKGKKAKKADGKVLGGDAEEAEVKNGRKWDLDEEMEDGAALEETPVAVGGEVQQAEVVVPASVPVSAVIEEDELL